MGDLGNPWHYFFLLLAMYRHEVATPRRDCNKSILFLYDRAGVASDYRMEKD